MQAALVCPLANQVPIGYCLAPAFSSATQPTISPMPPNASEAPLIPKPKTSPLATSLIPQRNKKCTKFSSAQKSPPTPNRKGTLPASVKQKKREEKFFAPL